MTNSSFPVLPLDDAVVLPGMVVPVELDAPDVRAAVDAAQLASTPVLLVPRPEGRYAAVGTLATVEQLGRLPGGQPAAVLRGTARATIGTGTTGPGAALWVTATTIEDAATYGDDVLALARDYKGLVTSILHQRGASQLVDSITRITDPSLLADTAGYAPYLTPQQKIEVLLATDVQQRLELVIGLAREHLAELDVAETLRKDVQEGMDRQQREFLLRQQLQAVKKELRELEGGPEAEDDDLRARVGKADLPEAVDKAVAKELDKLERTSEQSPEAGWIRTWLDTVLELPWGVRTEDSLDIVRAREVLDADHAGLEDVKERITEFLAVRRRREERGLGVVGGRRSGAVLALVGPPGVGKTSLGESVARALGRTFVRVALGGVRDEAEIRGHRRTYVGAMPGRIVRALKEAGSMNPVVLLDEIDKVGSDYRGDPTAALLEVLDPAQNHTFRDHYLEVELDLSDVVFLATANVLDTIPGPLLDRMELVRLDGYTEDEKVTIARDHLLPRQLERAGMTADEVTVEDGALRELAASYTREAGVRELERLLARVLRKAATRRRARRSSAPATCASTSGVRGTCPSPPSAPRCRVWRRAWPSPARAATCCSSRRRSPTQQSGATGVTLTGQLGDVMKESAQLAMSFLRSHGGELGLPVGDLHDRGVHLHVPAGSVPKDGPSAGVTMTTALASLLSGRPVRSDVAMTGEISLTGRVLPIGGVKQKLLAAHRAGITTVVIPARNEPDLDDVPASVLAELDVHPLSDVRDVLALALEPAPAQTLAA